MTNRFANVCIIVIYMTSLGLTLTYGCNGGWFGSRCQYQCHCKDNKCDDKGNCLKGATCQLGWFGPQCQYSDLATSGTVTEGNITLSAINDGDDKTCLNPTINKVTVAWQVSYYFTWIRVHVKEAKFLRDLTVKFLEFNKLLPIECTNRREAIIGDTTMDIYCNMTETVTEVIITGKGVQSLCSIYISGGRNVALKEFTKQSSSNSGSSNSPNAVDGNTSTGFENKSCTHTKIPDLKPNLNLTFTRPMNVDRFVIYNRHHSSGTILSRLQEFILSCSSQDKNELFMYKDYDTTPQLIYTIQLETPLKGVALVNVEATFYDTNIKSKVLTICELQIFGDNDCPSQKFGRECEKTCNCAKKEQCFVSTGGCTSGCAAGFAGEGCQNKIATNPTCPNGMFGANCKHKCKCADKKEQCNVTTGGCSSGCAAGFSGPGCHNKKKDK